MSSPTPRKDRRQKWWSEKQKTRATKREGLRPNPSAVDHFVITTENKGGFKPSDQIKKVLSSDHQTPLKASPNSQKTAKSKVQDKVKNSTDKKASKKNDNIKQESDNTSDTKPKLETNYVLFIGNLPYNVTKEDLEEHFRKTGGVKKVRIPQEKAKQRSRGFAYIEFKDRISHGIALRLHHTTLGGRKINVEFTSVGGNNQKRKDKLKQKNESLSKFKMPLDS
ncbi:uncharacterized protein LOC134708357 [Mytilus trossulus]|uniref:uncharacterized protein LOC134708357 n=1 Tax=Mytilus trossulus TaxID=6551 RepID=UPI00300647B4